MLSHTAFIIIQSPQRLDLSATHPPCASIVYRKLRQLETGHNVNSGADLAAVSHAVRKIPHACISTFSLIMLITYSKCLNPDSTSPRGGISISHHSRRNHQIWVDITTGGMMILLALAVTAARNWSAVGRGRMHEASQWSGLACIVQSCIGTGRQSQHQNAD